jgi:hypothetical protein
MQTYTLHEAVDTHFVVLTEAHDYHKGWPGYEDIEAEVWPS